MGLFFCFFIFWIQRSSIERVTIVDDVPDFDNFEYDSDVLYPAAMDEVTSEEIQIQKDSDLQGNPMSQKFKNLQSDSNSRF